MSLKRKTTDLFVPWDILREIRKLIDDSSIQNEFSGVFHKFSERHTHDHAGRVISTGCRASADKCIARATVSGGQGDSAQFFEEVELTYHTHPKYYYNEYHVKIAPPSGEDIGVFLRGAIEENSVVHLVFSVEGVYALVANPCFVEQARRLLERGERSKKALAAYNIALIGAEILGMETHECREAWSVDQWLAWIRGRFVCRNVDVADYKRDIRRKFKYHCESCDPLDVRHFQGIFKDIVRTSFELARCSDLNAVSHTRWSEGNWVDVSFKSWTELESRGGFELSKIVYV